MIEQFHFLRPAWLLVLLPLFAVLWLMLKYRFDSANWRAIIDRRLLPFVLTGGDSRHRRWPLWILVVVGLLAIVALAGPTWEKIPQPLYRDQAALVIALDLSRSMDAADIKPSRLARARHKIADILQRRKEGQTALVVYAADAFTVTPLTDDVDTILAMLPGLESNLMPAQGSRADRALQLASELFSNSGIASGDILLVNDGLSDRERERIEDMLDQNSGYRLSVLALGTPDGGPIPLRNGGFLKDRDGSIVIASLLQQNLRMLAARGGGVYTISSTGDIDINALVDLMESEFGANQARLSESSAELWRELGPWLILLALPIAALAFRRGLLWLVPITITALPPDAQAIDWAGLWQNPDQRASELFTQGEHGTAAGLFDDESWAASSHYRAGDYDSAIKQWQQITGVEALYNQGNALAQLGRFPDAIAAYTEVLRQNPDHEDALYNKQRIEDWLKQQQSQQQQDGEGQQSQAEQNESQSDPQPAAAGQDQSNRDEQAQAQSQQQEQPSGEQLQQQQAQDENHQKQDPSLAKLEQQMSEQAIEQWLRQIPDDPGGLLRRKFLFQYRQRGGVSAEVQAW